MIMKNKTSLVVVLSTTLLLSWVSFGEASIFFDDFSSYTPTGCLPDGTSVGPWNVVFAGFGCVEIEGDGANQLMSLVPKVTKGGNTHSALVVGPEFSSASTTSTFIYDV